MPKTILFLAFDGVTDLDLIGPIQVFSTASSATEQSGGQPIYTIVVASIAGGMVRTRSGLTIGTQTLAEVDMHTVDTIVVPGGRSSLEDDAEPPLVDWLAQNAGRARRICSVCVGAFLLGAAGLLDKRKATTHWRATELLKARYPSTTVVPELIYQQDGPVWTSAGVSAGIDLALHLVEQDHGRGLAMMVAKALVVFLRRPGGQKQFSSTLALQGNEAFSELIAWAADNLAEDLSVDALAERAAMSPRSFARKFHAAVGQTPAAAMEALRLEAAKRMLEDSSQPMKTIATNSGFGDLQGLRRAFIRALGITPSEYRERFG
ncbi:GlxA family transcriptional regulator [Mesorhizobium amorphae]|uniref:GlxA family transcriptional regulator n=1 Tax=Mesorhizobium amorphae TaxID=71433 RepID=UPI001186CE74|nr:DJ-1/PfpI family protein [Mesorhizobium amorphae]